VRFRGISKESATRNATTEDFRVSLETTIVSVLLTHQTQHLSSSYVLVEPGIAVHGLPSMRIVNAANKVI